MNNILVLCTTSIMHMFHTYKLKGILKKKKTPLKGGGGNPEGPRKLWQGEFWPETVPGPAVGTKEKVVRLMHMKVGAGSGAEPQPFFFWFCFVRFGAI